MVCPPWFVRNSLKTRCRARCTSFFLSARGSGACLVFRSRWVRADYKAFGEGVLPRSLVRRARPGRHRSGGAIARARRDRLARVGAPPALVAAPQARGGHAGGVSPIHTGCDRISRVSSNSLSMTIAIGQSGYRDGRIERYDSVDHECARSRSGGRQDVHRGDDWKRSSGSAAFRSRSARSSDDGTTTRGVTLVGRASWRFEVPSGSTCRPRGRSGGTCRRCSRAGPCGRAGRRWPRPRRHCGKACPSP